MFQKRPRGLSEVVDEVSSQARKPFECRSLEISEEKEEVTHIFHVPLRS